MLTGGKKVNYLMLSGEVFGAKNNFPKLYKFGNPHTGHYYNLSFDKDHNPVFTIQEFDYPEKNDYTAVISKTELVYDIIKFRGELYALCDCMGSYQDARKYCKTIVWIQMYEYGGGTPIEENGGVNSPSYLLIVYNMKEAISSC